MRFILIIVEICPTLFGRSPNDISRLIYYSNWERDSFHPQQNIPERPMFNCCSVLFIPLRGKTHCNKKKKKQEPFGGNYPHTDARLDSIVVCPRHASDNCTEFRTQLLNWDGGGTSTEYATMQSCFGEGLGNFNFYHILCAFVCSRFQCVYARVHTFDWQRDFDSWRPSHPTFSIDTIKLGCSTDTFGFFDGRSDRNCLPSGLGTANKYRYIE